MPDLQSLTMESPFGSIEVSGSEDEIISIRFVQENHKSNSSKTLPIFQKVRTQLFEYFDKRREHFDFRFVAEGSEFEQEVWSLIKQIPYGKTRSYSDLATALGDHSKVRAVARAASANPLLVAIPCHRVIGKNGSLTGYAGGLEVKKKLLELEGAISLQYSIY